MKIKDLRLAILDFPKRLLGNADANRLLNDMICQKQLNFERSSPSYVCMDKHDMIGTHFLIYDTKEMFRPKLVAAIRNTYEERAKEHGLTLPIENYFSALDPMAQEAVRKFRESKGSLVDCNAWFVDPAYSKANSDLNLSEILFFAVCLYIYRLGHDHFVGATNETYKASRWVAKVGRFQDGLTFVHPAVPVVHKLTLVEEFHKSWLVNCWSQYGSMMESGYEAIPDSISCLPLKTIKDQILNRNSKPSKLRVA